MTFVEALGEQKAEMFSACSMLDCGCSPLGKVRTVARMIVRGVDSGGTRHRHRCHLLRHQSALCVCARATRRTAGQQRGKERPSARFLFAYHFGLMMALAARHPCEARSTGRNWAMRMPALTACAHTQSRLDFGPMLCLRPFVIMQ